MKRYSILLFFVFVVALARAQYCGSSGGFQCTTDTGLVNPGFYPVPDSFPSFINNSAVNAVINFKNYDTIVFGNELLSVDYLHFDTIINLPPGLCWTTDQPTNTYSNAQAGCIKINGVPCGPTGQYKLQILVTVGIGGVGVETNGDPGGLIYFMRLKNYGDADIAVDDFQTDSMPFIPYGDSCRAISALSLSLGTGQTVCNGSIATLVPAVAGGQPPYTYSWTSTGSSLNCNNCANPVATVTQNSQFKLTVIDAGSMSATDSVSYLVSGTAINCLISASTTYFCDTGTAILQGAANNSVSYQWLDNGINIPGDTDSFISVSDSNGNFSLRFTEAGVCQAVSNVIPLSFFQAPPAVITTLGSSTICQGSVAILVADSIAGCTYSWLQNGLSTGDTTPVLTADTAGNYQVIMANAQCSSPSNIITITSNTNLPPIATLTGYPDTICFGTGAFALAGDSPTGGSFTGAAIWNSTFYPDSAIIGPNLFTYTYTDINGCNAWVTDTVLVVFCSPNSVNNIDAAYDVVLYPNPVTRVLYAESDLFTGNMRPVVYDITGKQIWLPFTQQDGKIYVETDELSPGFYVFSVNINGVMVNRRFLKLSE